MTQTEEQLLHRLQRLHDRVLHEPGQSFRAELESIAAEAEAGGVSLFRLITDHYPVFLPYYYFFEGAQ